MEPKYRLYVLSGSEVTCAGWIAWKGNSLEDTPLESEYKRIQAKKEKEWKDYDPDPDVLLDNTWLIDEITVQENIGQNKWKDIPMTPPDSQMWAFLEDLNNRNKEDIKDEYRHKFKRIVYELSLDAYSLSCGDILGNSFSGEQNIITYYVKAVRFQPHLETLMTQGAVEFTTEAVLNKLHSVDDYNYPERAINESSIFVQDGQIKARLALDQEKRFTKYNIEFIASSHKPYIHYPSSEPPRDIEEVKQRLI